MILAVSHAADEHAQRVLGFLNEAGHPVTLLDTAAFPSTAFLSQALDDDSSAYEFRTSAGRVNLGDCRAGWWRRPQPFTLQPGIAADVAPFTYTECHEAVSGLWHALDLEWINPPHFDEVAHHKPYQLAVARRAGLPIPRTLITNDPSAARSLIDELGPHRTIYKTFLATEQFWRETRLVRPEELELLDRVALAPVIFQEFVPATADIRATVVGSRIFAAAISAAPGGYEIDYRMDLDGARFEPLELPADVERRIHALMQRLGLVYGAVDLRRTSDGGYVFLEVNPAGEWLFVEDRTGLPISAALAALLADFDRRKRLDSGHGQEAPG